MGLLFKLTIGKSLIFFGFRACKTVGKVATSSSAHTKVLKVLVIMASPIELANTF